MSIRLRTTLIITAVALASLLALALLSRFILLPEFEEIERAEMVDYSQQVLGEFDEKYESVANSLEGDAFWDETQVYLRGGNPAYPEENTTPDYIAALNLNFIAFADVDGNILSHMMVDIGSEREVPVLPGLLDAIAPLTDISLYPGNDSRQFGVIDIDGELLIVAALPALSNERRGPPAGTVIGAFILNEKRQDDLIDSNLISLSLFPISQTLPDEFEHASSTILKGEIHVHPLSLDTLAGYSFVRTPRGEPSAVLQVRVGRERLQNAFNTVNLFIVAIVVGGFTAMILVLILLDRTLLARIKALQQWMDERAGGTPTTERVQVSGNDEISSLARSFNSLLDRLTRTHTDATRARDEALAALEFKQQLLANISHDARTPLSVIMLRTENIKRGMYGVVSERQQQVLDGVRASANQMLFFINNLLAGAKLQAGALTMRADAVTVARFADDVRTMMEPLAYDQGLTLSLTVDPLLPPVLLGDSDRLKQIIFNLIDNAIKFTADGGSIDAALRVDDGAHWLIEVKDTGAGIPQDKLATIFEAFFQIDSSSTRRANSGVGLGLSIVRQLVGLMHGRVDVQSEVGKGTTFTVSLPMVIPELERV